MKRKHILLKNEIEIIQMTLQNKVYPDDFWRIDIIERLDILKKKWYPKSKSIYQDIKSAGVGK